MRFRGPQTFTTDASIGADGAAAANINVTGKHGAFSVDKLAVGTDKKIIGEFSLGAVAPGTDLNFKCVFACAWARVVEVMGVFARCGGAVAFCRIPVTAFVPLPCS